MDFIINNKNNLLYIMQNADLLDKIKYCILGKQKHVKEKSPSNTFITIKISGTVSQVYAEIRVQQYKLNIEKREKFFCIKTKLTYCNNGKNTIHNTGAVYYEAAYFKNFDEYTARIQI